MTNDLKSCKVYWCLKEDPKRQYHLESTTGECLEEVGIPNRGRAVINRTIKPKVGDIVWCDNQFGTISGFLKQVKSFDGEEMVVTTRYKDHSKNYEFYCFAFYGVVEMVFDNMGDLCYRRVTDGEKAD